MRTIFSLFSTYEDANAAIQYLIDNRFTINEMNAIIQRDIAEEHMKINPRKANISTMNGIDKLLAGVLAGKQTENTYDAGRVYAAGDLATELAKVAELPRAAGKGLKSALIDFNIPEEVAESFIAGIKGGGILFFIRTSDERASTAANILQFYKGKHVSSYSR